MQRIKFENGWCRCGKCGHKLFKAVGEIGRIEIKCSSCKEINISDSRETDTAGQPLQEAR